MGLFGSIDKGLTGPFRAPRGPSWLATALDWWRTHFRKQAMRVAALEETVRKMSDVVSTKQIVTRSVMLVDKQDQVRGTLAVGNNGAAALVLMDEDHRVRIGISVDDQPGIRLYDASGLIRAAMTLRHGIAAIRVYGAGSAQMALVGHNESVAALAVDKQGKLRGILASSARRPYIMLLDAEGKPMFRAPPVDDSDQGDGLDWKGVFGV